MEIPDVSVVVPAFNEEGCFPSLFDRVRAAIGRCDVSYEIVLVDDGSSDRTYALARQEADASDNLRVIRLSRNFGHQAALIAGMRAARGRAVITMDADLQHPPELIEDLVASWREGYDVVHTIRVDTRRSAGFLKRMLSAVFYFVFKRLTGLELRAGMADYRLTSRKALEPVISAKEVQPFLRGMFVSVGFRQTFVEYQAGERAAGHSGYTWKKMSQFALHAIVGYSAVPLFWSFGVGIVTALISALYGLYVLYIKIFTVEAVPGWASLALLLSFFVSLQFLFLGLLGAYVAAIYSEVKQRPTYVIAEVTPPDDLKDVLTDDASPTDRHG